MRYVGRGGEREEKELGRGASEPLLPNTGWSMYLLCLLQQDEEERKQREAEAAKKKEEEGGAEEEDEEFDDEEVRKQIFDGHCTQGYLPLSSFHSF